MNRNKDGVANTNYHPDFNTFWKQLYGQQLSWTTAVVADGDDDMEVICSDITPKRMEYWDMAIEAGFSFDDLESMVDSCGYVALSSHLVLCDGSFGGGELMCIESIQLLLAKCDDQLGAANAQTLHFLLRLAAKACAGQGIELYQHFVDVEEFHDVPLVTSHTELHYCNLVGRDKLMFNIIQNSKSVEFGRCALAGDGADLCRWLSLGDCRVTKLSFRWTFIACDLLAKLLQSNKQIDNFSFDFNARPYRRGGRFYTEQDINRIIELLSDATHLKELEVDFGTDQNEPWSKRFDDVISLMGNSNLSYLHCLNHSYRDANNPVTPEILCERTEALRRTLQSSHQLTYLRISPCPIDKLEYDALVDQVLQRNYQTKVRRVLSSLSTWSQPLALFGEALSRVCSRRFADRTFRFLLESSEVLKRAWNDNLAVRMVEYERGSSWIMKRRDEGSGVDLMPCKYPCLDNRVARRLESKPRIDDTPG